MKYIYILLIALCFTNCQSNSTEATQEATIKTIPNETPSIETSTNIDKETVETSSTDSTPKSINSMFHEAYDMGTFTLNLFARNGETSTFKLESAKLARAFNEKYSFEGQVEQGYVLDLNGDGFKELYLVCSITDDSGNKNIMAWTSYKDKALGVIYVDDTKVSRMVNSDRVFTKNGKLYRDFTNANGNKTSFEYVLKKGEAGMKLTPKAR